MGVKLRIFHVHCFKHTYMYFLGAAECVLYIIAAAIYRYLKRKCAAVDKCPSLYFLFPLSSVIPLLSFLFPPLMRHTTCVLYAFYVYYIIYFYLFTTGLSVRKTRTLLLLFKPFIYFYIFSTVIITHAHVMWVLK